METRERKVLRFSKDEMVGGVVAGLAEYLGISSAFLRAAYALLSLLTMLAPGVVLYVLLAFVMVLNEDRYGSGGGAVAGA